MDADAQLASADLKPVRKALSKKLRFEVFKRDSFTCQYCGAHPPGVLLHVDHIRPVAEGGKNNIDNLVTACEPCNLGKGARSLSAIPTPLSEKAALVAERELQIKGYNEVMEGRRRRLTAEAWQVVHMLTPGVKETSRDWMNSLRNFIDKLGFPEVEEAMSIAMGKSHYSDDQTWRYFCGICWNKVRKAESDDA